MNERGAHQPITSGPSESNSLRDSVIDALQKLPEKNRLVVTLRVMDGMPGKEVQKLVGCSASEVSRRLHQGMEELRKLLEDWESYNPG